LTFTHKAYPGMTQHIDQWEKPATPFPPPTNGVQILRQKYHKKKSGLINALKKEFNNVTGTSTLNNKEQAKPNDGKGVTSQLPNIKLDQDGNLDKLNAGICKRRLQNTKQWTQKWRTISIVTDDIQVLK
jgi:hypothetical protein